MLKMTEQDIRSYVKARLQLNGEDGLDGRSTGLEFNCIARSGKWVLVLVVDGAAIGMKSQREDYRLFANLDSAYKVASSILSSMLIIGTIDN